MKYKNIKKLLIFWCLFIGVGAIFGALGMFLDPSGKLMKMDQLLPYFQVLPFSKVLYQNYIFPGIALFIVNGITNLFAAFLIFKNKKSGIVLGTIFGITLMMWIIIQFVIFPFNFLSTSFFVFGILQALTGYLCYVVYTQEKFVFNETEYKNIGKNEKILVVYFSRRGYTKKEAYRIANETSAKILELKTTEKTEGTLGFWWCGRFGMHKWWMELKEIKEDVSKYEKVIIVTPIWVFSMSAPIRKFCYTYSEKLKNVEYVVTHFMRTDFLSVANEMDKILKVKRKSFKTIVIRMGNKLSEKIIK